jgi:tocopherol O-methyltransferase
VTSPTPASVADYYDRNTSRFLRFGGSRGTAAIHRRIWAPGVKNDKEAFVYLNRLVAGAIRTAFPASESGARVLDVGCGVGGTATWVADHLGVLVTGVANSPVQLEIARQRAQNLGLEERCDFVQADFLRLPSLGNFQAAWAIESFIHALDPSLFFKQISALLDPGGLLVICDDFLARPMEEIQEDRYAAAWIQRFQHRWQAPNLVTSFQAVVLAEMYGLSPTSSQDLTPWLRLHPKPVLRLLAQITRLPLRSTYWQNLAGGSALQVCIQNGWTKYQSLVLKKE